MKGSTTSGKGRLSLNEKKRREELLKKANESFARLRRDRNAWKEELKERALWESTLFDGLEEDEPFTN